MAEAGFVRRAAPAVGLAVAGGVLLYLLPSSGDSGAAAGDEVTAAPTASPTAPSAGPPGATAAPRVIPGNAVQFRFGTVQAAVSLDGARIANIATLKAPGGGYQSYTDRAIPTMKSRILAAQSTRVATVSGATYTSRAYAQSVQSALDKG